MSSPDSVKSLVDKYVYRQSIENKDLFDAYMKEMQSFWLPNEIDFSRDKESFDKLETYEKNLVFKVLSFFAASDGIVNENIIKNFMDAFPAMEVSFFYGFQFMMEQIHMQVYSKFIETYAAGDEDLKSNLFSGIEEDKYIRRKAEWAIDYINREDATLAERILAFSIVEGVFFSGSFCVIFWFKSRGLLPGLCQANELISRDESLHADFAALLYKKYYKNTPEALSSSKIHEMFESAINIEHEFIDSAFGNDPDVSFPGMNADAMKQYICFVADGLLIQAGEPILYNAENPFSFMDNLSMEGKTNFFEKKVTEYKKNSISSSTMHDIVAGIGEMGDLEEDDF